MTHSSNLSTGLTQKLRHTYSLASVLKQVLRLLLHHRQHPLSSGAEGALTARVSRDRVRREGETLSPGTEDLETTRTVRR